MPDRTFILAPLDQSPARRERLWRWYSEALRRTSFHRADRHAQRVAAKAEKLLGIITR